MSTEHEQSAHPEAAYAAPLIFGCAWVSLRLFVKIDSSAEAHQSELRAVACLHG